MARKPKVSIRVTQIPRYSEAFKRKVVREYETGKISKNELQRKYGLGGNAIVLKWCKKYGKFDYNIAQTFFTVNQVQQQQKRIRELEKQLKEAEVRKCGMG